MKKIKIYAKVAPCMYLRYLPIGYYVSQNAFLGSFALQVVQQKNWTDIFTKF
jgi:hypothetical protein